MQRFKETLALVFLASVLGSCLAAPVGLPLLSRLDLLPTFRDPIQIGSVSSYDRTGGNDDGFSGKYSFVRKDAEGLILADLKGPGVIYRVWTPTPTDDTIEFLFDGEDQPRLQLPFRQMFLGRHPAFPKPLAGYGGGGFYSYVPLPFAKSCVVRIRAPKMQFYQINYALYPPGTDLSTFALPLNAADQAERDRACATWARAGTDLAELSAPPGSPIDRAQRDIVLQPGAAETVYEDLQGGRVVGFIISPASAVASKARDLVLRITFDGHALAVLCPLADFFGYAWGQPAMRSLLVGTVGDTNYSYFPMPYEHSARVEILSERSAPVSLHVEIAHTGVPQTAAEGKFHALWRRENPTTLGQPYRFSKPQGAVTLSASCCKPKAWNPARRSFLKATMKPPSTVNQLSTAPGRKISSMEGGMTCPTVGKSAFPFRSAVAWVTRNTWGGPVGIAFFWEMPMRIVKV